MAVPGRAKRRAFHRPVAAPRRTPQGRSHHPRHDQPHRAAGFAVAREALAEAGVVLTFVRQVPGTRVCGATWWLGSERPVIGLTERHRKPDTFWFNLLHEIGHILLHPRRTTFLDLDVKNRPAAPQKPKPTNSQRPHSCLPTHAPPSLPPQPGKNCSVSPPASASAPRSSPATMATPPAAGTSATLRGTITDDDIRELEQISNRGQPATDERPGEATRQLMSQRLTRRQMVTSSPRTRLSDFPITVPKRLTFAVSNATGVPAGQVPDQPQQRLGAVHHVLVQLHLSVLGDYRHLGPLAVHIDADVDIAGSPLPSLESLTRSVPLPG